MMVINIENQSTINESYYTKRKYEASVLINQKLKSEIKQGLVVLLGISADDCLDDIEWLCKKIIALRVFLMNRAK